MSVIPVVLLLLIFTLASAAMSQSSQRDSSILYTYDLTYTLKLDREDEAQRRTIWDHAHFVSSVQGIVNREYPRMYMYFIGGNDGPIDRYWLGKLQEPDEWLADHRLEEIPDIKSLVAKFRDDINGLVVYDEKVPSTSNVASTVAGVHSFAAVRFDSSPESLYHWLIKDPDGPQLPVKVWLVHPCGNSMFTGKGTIPGLDTPSTGSAKCDAYIWAKEKLLDTGKANPTKMGYYIDAYWLQKPGGDIPNHTLSNHDYFIANRGFFFDLSPWEDETPIDDPDQPLGTDVETLKAILRSAYDQTQGKEMIHIGGFVPWDKKYTDLAGGKREAVPGEWRYVEIASCFNAYVDADALGYGCMANASVFQHYPLDDHYPQDLPTVDDLKARGFIDSDGRVAPKSYVTIYVGDYDAAAWLYRRLPVLWEDPARGSVPLGWAFNPNLADRFAPGMAYTRKTKTDNDFFVAGDSGAGYVNPGHLQEPRRFSGLPSGVATWAEHCAKYYKQWDLSLTGFIIDGYAPPMSDEVLDAYAKFSPSGIVAQKIDRWGVHKGMPFIRMNSDLVGSPEESADVILSRVGNESPEFFIFRNILWSPSGQKAMFDKIQASDKGDSIEIVDPYTLMLLIKQNEAAGQ